MKNILQKTAEESLGKTKVTHKRRCLKIWDNEIKEVIEEKKIAYRRQLNIRSIQDKTNYKQLSVKQVKKRFSWEKFVSQMEYDFGKPKETQNSATF